ncbi:MAG: phytanoyl-CoA dioxygenase [Kordiimonadaceae bacterium]|nr:phytanoyl-CoA dioxygenase [Kordiimonadaceae bacterium]MBT6032136.1 phytanoyl-CoA dioxygenase [Kordiimonadaceae bacterium]
MSGINISDDQIKRFQEDGVVLIKGLFKDWVDIIRAGIEHNMREPGPYAAENLKEGDDGRFFDDYCNWTRIAEFEDVIRHSDAGRVAAELMKSKKSQVFHDHVLVKEPGTSKATPWHQDSPYYFVEGAQTISLWSPMDPVKDAALRCVAGSHKWPKPVLPTRWLSEENFYPNEDEYMQVPDLSSEEIHIKEWEMEPGDAVAFNYKILHGARGNNTDKRRRAFSLRFVGDDTRYITRPGPTSPPFPGHNMNDGEVLREDWFPIIYSRTTVS